MDKVILAVVTSALTAIATAILTVIFVEPIKALLKKTGAWIGSLFDRNDRWFRRRYPDALAERHRWLKLIGIYNSADLHPPRLQEVYVSLRLAAARGEDGPRFSWHEIFQPGEKRLVILGSPGAGKSTLLDYLVLIFTGQVRHPLCGLLDEPFPLFARLRELGTAGAETVPALLARSVPLEKVPADFPERWLRRGGCVVLLDGLDEVLDQERHDRAVEEIKRLVAEHPDNHYVVTCRVAGWRNQLEGFRTYEVQPFTAEDIRQFIGVWYREVLRTREVGRLGANAPSDRLAVVERDALAEAGERTQALWQALEPRVDLLRVASTPLLLSLITLVHFHRPTDLPRGRAKLYEQCVEILVDLWDRQDKRLKLPEVPSLKEKRMVLESIAYHYLKEDLLEAGVPALQTVVESLLPRIEARLKAEELIHQIWQRSGILQDQRPGWFGFAHRALHDFLAAAYLVEHELDDLLLQNAGVERWREVVLIAAGLAPAKRAERLVGALLAASGDSAAELEMAGLTLAEDIQLGADLRAEVRRRLLDRLSREEAEGPFRRLAGALMAADLGAAQEWMKEELRGRDPQRQAWVLERLPELGATHAGPLTAMVLRLAEEGAEEVVRARALRVLSGLKVPWSTELREVLTRARGGKEPEPVKRAAAWAWCELGRPEDLGLVRIPAGEFLMGSSDIDADSAEQPQHTLHLPSFYIGRYPVKVEDFQAFLAAAGYRLKREERFRAWNVHADHPVVAVSWHDALAYAQWHGLGLPSEAEWEKAARGIDGRRYPWGNRWEPGFANTTEQRTTGLSWFWLRPQYGTTTPVGAYSLRGDSPYGCADMAGNVWEWTCSAWGEDWKQPSFCYPYAPMDGREDTEAYPQCFRVLRGGSYIYYSWFARCASRNRFDPDGRDVDAGFRVVLSPFSSGL